jgi:hypothetical protein
MEIHSHGTPMDLDNGYNIGNRCCHTNTNTNTNTNTTMATSSLSLSMIQSKYARRSSSAHAGHAVSRMWSILLLAAMAIVMVSTVSVAATSSSLQRTRRHAAAHAALAARQGMLNDAATAPPAAIAINKAHLEYSNDLLLVNNRVSKVRAAEHGSSSSLADGQEHMLVEGEPNSSTPPTGPGGKNVPVPSTVETDEDLVSPMPATPLAFFPESCSSNASLDARECCPSHNGMICGGRGSCVNMVGNDTDAKCNGQVYASIFWFSDYFDKGNIIIIPHHYHPLLLLLSSSSFGVSLNNSMSV